MYLYDQPIYILSENTRRTSGRDAQRWNILAGRAVASAVRTTLGPKGMDKMLVDASGNVVITNDGATILTEMDVEHPAAQMMVEVAETQESETGDGTTTAVVLAGELLSRAEDLIESDVHPTVVANGYRFAAAEARSVLEGMATPADETRILEVARTAMTGKGPEAAKEHLADLVFRAVEAVREEDGDIDLENVAVEGVVGASVDDASLVEGVVLSKERMRETMPHTVEDARIALVDAPVEIRETEVDAHVDLSTTEQLEAFLAHEESEFRAMAAAVTDAGANVLVCRKKVDDVVAGVLAKAGVFVVQRAKADEMRALARATGAKRVSTVTDLTEADLGAAGLVEQRDVGDETFVFVEECADPASVTILLRGGTEHVVGEVERAVADALGVVRVSTLDELVLPGGGAPEIELARALREFAGGIAGREQLAVEAFADAVEVVPRTLAENAGLDPIDSIVALRAAHEAGETAAGLDAYTGEVSDMYDLEVVEPLAVKLQAVEGATECVELLLRIDDVVAARASGGSATADAF
jgi:thermosome